MRKFIMLIVCGTFLFSCDAGSDAEQKDEKMKTEVKNFDWLLGNWKRNNEEKGKETFENWNKINDSEYNGIGFTIKNGDTVSRENMRLIQLDGKWNLTVQIPGEKEPTAFLMSEIAKEKFVCVNDSIEFPKRIEYGKAGEKMNALVSGDSLKITFEFERVK